MVGEGLDMGVELVLGGLDEMLQAVEGGERRGGGGGERRVGREVSADEGQLVVYGAQAILCGLQRLPDVQLRHCRGVNGGGSSDSVSECSSHGDEW